MKNSTFERKIMEQYIVYKYDKSSVYRSNLNKNDKIYTYRKFLFGAKDKIFKSILFAISARGKHKILCVENEKKEIIHYSFVIPYCRKFQFMKKGDYCIGPCWTHPDYRGKGIYGNVLDYVSTSITSENNDADCYVLIREANIASSNGIKKSKYIPVGTIRKTKILKHYKTVFWYNKGLPVNNEGVEQI